MRPIIALTLTVVIGLAIAVGVNSVLGDPPKPEEFVPPPGSGPYDPNEPPLKPGEEIESGDSDYGADLPPGSVVETTDTLSVAGKTVRLPEEVTFAIGINPDAPLLPCSNLRSDEQMAMVVVDGGGGPLSWVRFTLDGRILESRIYEPQREVLEPLLAELRPATATPELEPCVIINGEIVPLPPGARFSGPPIGHRTHLAPKWWPDDYQVVNYGESVVFLTDNGAILHSDISASDAEALQPLFSALRLRIRDKLLPIPPGASVRLVVHGANQPPAPEGWPPSYLEITAGDSWMKYVPDDGVVLDQRMGASAEILRPVAEELGSR